MEYAVIYERTPTGFSAFVPALPGCIAAGGTRAEVEKLISEAIRLHLQDTVAAEPSSGRFVD
jgi:predicted RNase H-like HicB family nuclease